MTWRQPEIVPLNPVAVYPVTADRACDRIAAAFASLGLESTETMRAATACVIETDYRRLDAPGDPFDDLRDLGYVSGGDLFSHGRYLLTAAIRENADGNARVRLTSRLEGFDAGYRTVRSNGTVEGVAFERLSEALEVQPLTNEGR